MSLVHNFDDSLFFRILSPLDSEINLQQNLSHIPHHTLNVLLQYPVNPYYVSYGLMFTTDVYFLLFLYFTTGSPSSLDRSPWNFATWSIFGWIL